MSSLNIFCVDIYIINDLHILALFLSNEHDDSLFGMYSIDWQLSTHRYVYMLSHMKRRMK